MEKIFFAQCMEHEFGQRPDGVLVSDSRDELEFAIKKDEKNGNAEQFWRYNSVEEAYCSAENFIKIKERMGDYKIIRIYDTVSDLTTEFELFQKL